jgi:hypothetical protein
MSRLGQSIGIAVLVVAGCAGGPDGRPAVAKEAVTVMCPLDTLNLGGDHWGCDVIDNIGYFFGGDPAAISDSSKGQCCDRHDAELANLAGSGVACSGNPSDPPWIIAISCIINGWSPICDDPCVSVHVRVARCFLDENPGPSVCTQWGVCGYNRNLNDPWGCVSDSQCASGTICNCRTGVCTCLGCCELLPPPQCGPYTDDCGFQHDAGACPEGWSCQFGGCVQVCTAIRPQCGPYNDSCGNPHDAGPCPPGWDCQGGSCVQVCTANPPQCGPYSDSCGNPRDAGPCPPGWDCQGGNCVQVCTAIPPQCGPYSDSCGNPRDAGPCPPGWDCQGGTCVQVCTAIPPQCGPYYDSCGNPRDAGPCPYGYDCQGGSCVQVEYCGNGVCGGGESCASCPYDCGDCGPVCGNGLCESGEEQGNWNECCSDCWCNPCGDGYCDYYSECSWCYEDCWWVGMCY